VDRSLVSFLEKVFTIGSLTGGAMNDHHLAHQRNFITNDEMVSVYLAATTTSDYERQIVKPVMLRNLGAGIEPPAMTEFFRDYPHTSSHNAQPKG
jgi:hypothetical protein